MKQNKEYIEDVVVFEKEDNNLKFNDIIRTIAANWYWFVIAIVICCGLTALYLKVTPKIYERTASLLIKDNNNNSSLSESLLFDNFNMFKLKSNIDNEILILKSERLMTETAKRLNLDVSYIIRDGLRKRELYKMAPISVHFIDAEGNKELSMRAILLPDKKVELFDFSSERDTSIVAMLNDTIVTPIGKISIMPTLYYSDNYFDIPITIKKSILKNTVQKYRDDINVELSNEGSTIINLTLRDMSKVRAEDVINTLIAVYNEDVIDDKNQIAINTSNFINDRLIIIEKELGSVDSNIAAIKSQGQITDFASEAGLYLEESSAYNREGLYLENQLSLAKFVMDYLKNPQNNFSLIPANTGILDANIENTIAEYNNLMLKRDKLISNSSEQNPVILDINNSLHSLKQNIILTIDNYIVSLNLKLKNTRQQEMQTSRRLSAIPSQQKNITSVGREQKIKEELYLYLLSKREENALTQAITISNARVIDSAAGPDDAVAPQNMKIMLIALLIGLIIPSLILWVRMMLNTKVSTLKDVEKATSIPILGEIPKREKNDNRSIVITKDGTDPISEAFRIVRTNIDFMQTDENRKQVVMFTSFNPYAGKTFISTNLALSFAMLGKKVILLDLDIRKGMLSKNLANSKKIGMTNYLSGKVDNINDIIIKGEQNENLDIIHSGPIPPNPVELLLSHKLEEAIAELKKHYDYIFIDNVPAGIVADASIVNRVVDLTIYVIRAGNMEKHQLPELEKLYHQDKFNNMTLILNSIQKNYTRYGYGYGYGYGNEKK